MTPMSTVRPCTVAHNRLDCLSLGRTLAVAPCHLRRHLPKTCERFSPGVLSGEKQRIGRDYDFASVISWFAER